MSTVLSMGSFDILHSGHVELFEACRRIAGLDGRVVATVNDSEFIAEFKGKPPVQSTTERMTMVNSVRYVDEAYILAQQDAKPMIEMVHPDFIVIGSDWAVARPDGSTYLDQLCVTAEWLRKRKIILLFQFREGLYSSTSLKERVRNA